MTAEYTQFGKTTRFDVTLEAGVPPDDTTISDRSVCGKYVITRKLRLHRWDVKQQVAVYTVWTTEKRKV